MVTLLKQTLTVIGQALSDYYQHLYQLFPMGMVTLLACAIILPGPPALAGLWETARRAARAEPVTWAAYWEGCTVYALKAWGVVGLGGLGAALVAVNVWFYTTPVSPVPPQIGVWIARVWGFIALLGLGALFYVGAFLVALEQPRIEIAFRSSLYLTLLHPLPTLIWLLVTGALLAVSFYAPILFGITPALIALLSAQGLRALTETIFTSAAPSQ